MYKMFRFASVVALLILGSSSHAQLLFKGGEPYVNYAYEGYRPYESVLFGRDRRPQFDELGQFLMNGIRVFELREFRTIYPTPGTLIAKPEFYQDYLNRLVISKESYGGGISRLIVGDYIRTKFTSLTLDKATINGIRFDRDFSPWSLVLVASREDFPIFEALGNADYKLHGEEGSLFKPSRAVYLLGGDLRAQFMGLDVGVSWVNQYRTDSFKTLSENSIKGTLPATGHPPLWLVVRVADQDPDDDLGVRVRQVVLALNGRVLRYRPGPYDKLRPEELTLTVTHQPERTIIPPVRRDNMNNLVIPFPHLLPNPQGFYEISGKECILFWFRVPSIFADGLDTTVVNRARIDVEVSGDYEIALSEVFDGDSFNPATYFYTAARAKGRPRDLDDFRWVRVHYGRQTGRMLASFHIDLDRKGYMFHAEYVRNFSFRSYPALVPTFARHVEHRTYAWYAIFRRDWDWASLGGEIFDIAADYSTALVVQDDQYATYYKLKTSPFSYPNFHEPDLPSNFDLTNTIVFNTVDDNDDKDRYPDQYFLRKTTGLTGGRYIEDPDGVFPGLDSDLNGRPDINENANRIPDYYEPFLCYKVNPDAYEYGDDFNNNGVIDEREDDLKPDYPYDPDRRGLNLFAQLRPLKGLKLTFGHYTVRAPYGGRRSDATYGKVEYRCRFPFLIDLYLADDFKSVRDDIRDDVFGLPRDPIYFEPDVIPLAYPTEQERLNPLGTAVLQRDPLLMRDSFVNTAYLHARFLRVPNLNLEFSLKYQDNFQRRTRFQPENRIRDLAAVVKADYTWNPWGQLFVRPQFKWLGRRYTDDRKVILPVRESFLFPILRVEYHLSPRTAIKFGAQGFPFFKSTYRNGEVPEADFDSETYVFLVSNTSTCVGYKINVNLGYELRRRIFLERSRSEQNIDYSRLFFRVIVGLRPFT
ncbi:MAG TPA: hypothetical protein EYP61_08480 [Candidatus Latescibacteria bacterium]|nr:hypothetical protein [Candidatus Latescibacterota bacterium]